MRGSPGVPTGRRCLPRRGREEFELDVVRVTEHQDRSVGGVHDRRLGQWLVGGGAAPHSVGVQVFLPRLEIAAGGQEESGVIESGAGFGGCPAVVRVVSVQRDHEFAVGVGEDLSHSAGVWDVHEEVNVEDRLVPANAGVQVGHGKREVMQSGSVGGWHGVVLTGVGARQAGISAVCAAAVQRPRAPRWSNEGSARRASGGGRANNGRGSHRRREPVSAMSVTIGLIGCFGGQTMREEHAGGLLDELVPPFAHRIIGYLLINQAGGQRGP